MIREAKIFLVDHTKVLGTASLRSQNSPRSPHSHMSGVQHSSATSFIPDLSMASGEQSAQRGADIGRPPDSSLPAPALSGAF